MKIEINEEIDRKLWNHFSNEKIFFRFEWYYILQESYGLKPYFILVYEDEKFALIASFKISGKYISMPFVNYSGFLSNDEKILTILKEHLQENNIDIDSRDLLDKEVESGYVNPIAKFESMDDFWKNIQSRFRGLMRKSQRQDLSFKIDDKFDKFYNTYLLGMRNLGTPAHGKKYFEKLMEYIPYHIFTVYDNDKCIGSLFCLNDNDTLLVLYAYTLPEYSKKYANYFLYLNTIEWMTQNHLVYLDMGRSTYNEGTYHFKKKFKPKFYAINSKINYSNDSKMQLASNIWKKLPLPVANFISPYARRYLP